MRGLFIIYVVNPVTEEVGSFGPVVARDEATARLKAGIDIDPKENLDDWDFIVVRLGNVRDKPAIQEVKIVG